MKLGTILIVLGLLLSLALAQELKHHHLQQGPVWDSFVKENALPDGSEFRCSICKKTFGDFAFATKHLSSKHLAEFENYSPPATPDPLSSGAGPVIVPNWGYNDIAMTAQGLVLYNKNDPIVGASLRNYGEYASLRLDIIAQMLRKGDVVVHVGAGYGDTTLALAKLVTNTGAVVAFEMQRVLHQTLAGTVQLNSQAHVLAYNVAAGAKVGSVQLPVFEYGQTRCFTCEPMPKLDTQADPDTKLGERVPVTAVDSLALTRVRLLLIDTPSSAVQVLQGSKDTITKLRPLIFVELNDDLETSIDITAEIGQYNYTFYVHDAPLHRPDNFLKNSEDFLGGRRIRSLLAVPSEIQTDVEGLTYVGASDALPTSGFTSQIQAPPLKPSDRESRVHTVKK